MKPHVTALLAAWGQGDESALARLAPLVYGELRRLARRHMRQQQPDHTPRTTALVNEAYLRLVDLDRIEWQDRAHFLAMAATLMRRTLVDHARSHRRLERGGARRQVTLDEELLVAVNPPEDLAALDTIGGYRIVALAGAGGMGEVYRPRDLRLERDVALKLFALAGCCSRRVRPACCRECSTGFRRPIPGRWQALRWCRWSSPRRHRSCRPFERRASIRCASSARSRDRARPFPALNRHDSC